MLTREELIEQNQKLMEIIAELQKSNEELKESIAYLTKQLYGRSSERTAALKLEKDQISFFDEAEQEANGKSEEAEIEEIEEIEALYQEAQNVLIVLGDDLISHPRASNIAHLAGLIAMYGKAKLCVVGATPEMVVETKNGTVLEDVEDIKSFDGVVIYQCPAINNNEENLLIGSAQFQMAAKVQNGDKITVAINQEVYPRTFVRDDSLKGVIALMPCAKADSSYPYHVVKIVKAEVQ